MRNKLLSCVFIIMITISANIATIKADSDRNIIGYEAIDTDGDGTVDSAKITYGIYDEEIKGDTKTLKCLYKDYNGYYDGISLQLIIDVKLASSSKTGTTIITPQFYFPDSVVEEMQENGFLNEDKEYDYIPRDINGNKKSEKEWKSIYDGLGYDSSTFKNNSTSFGSWQQLITDLNINFVESKGNWKEESMGSTGKKITYGYTYYDEYGNHNTSDYYKINRVSLSLYEEIDDADIASLIVDGEFMCPNTIGVLLPSDEEAINKQYTQLKSETDDLFLMGYFDYDTKVYQTKVVIPELITYNYAPFFDYSGYEKIDENGQNIYTGKGKWSNLDVGGACYYYGNHNEWANACYFDDDYGIIYFPLTGSDVIKYTEEESEELEQEEDEDENNLIEEGPEAIVDYCDDLKNQGMSIGSDQNRINTSSCYYKVYSKDGTSNPDKEIFPHTYNGSNYICIQDAGFIQYKETEPCNSLYIIGNYTGYGVQPYSSEVIGACVNFYTNDNASYVDSNNDTACTSQKATKYYCACKQVGLCTYTSGVEETVNYYDCSNCQSYVDPCTGVSFTYVCGLFGKNTWPYIKNLYKLIKIIIPALIIVLGMIDFMKVLFSGEEKDMKTSGTKFLKRIIAGIVFILLPVLLEFLIGLFGFSENCLQKFIE